MKEIRSVYFKVGKESGQNSSVVTGKVRIPMFGRIRSEGKESGQNSSVVTDKVRIPMFGRIRSEL